MTTKKLSSSWQVLSTQSAKVTNWLIAIVFFNFCGLWLNLRIDGMIMANFYHQIFWVTIAGIFLGGSELIGNRQELTASLPIPRRQLLLNRLLYGFLLIFVLFLLNYLINSGSAEDTLFGEVWLEGKTFSQTLKQTALLLATFCSSFAIAYSARTFTGLIATFFMVAGYFVLGLFFDLELTSALFLGSISISSLSLLFTAFCGDKRISKVRQGILTITCLTRVDYIYLATFLTSLVLFIIKQEVI